MTEMIVSLLIEEPSSRQGGGSTEPSQPEAAAAAGALNPSTLLYTPTKGYKELSAISNGPCCCQLATMPTWWHGPRGSSLPQQQQQQQQHQVMQNEPWRQHGYPHGLPTSQLPGPWAHIHEAAAIPAAHGATG